MEEANAFSQEQKTESLRKALIGAGYDMAASQAESKGDGQDFLTTKYLTFRMKALLNLLTIIMVRIGMEIIQSQNTNKEYELKICSKFHGIERLEE